MTCSITVKLQTQFDDGGFLYKFEITINSRIVHFRG
jgi:hypothetical protein